jgi:hypothetical protein
VSCIRSSLICFAFTSASPTPQSSLNGFRMELHTSRLDSGRDELWAGTGGKVSKPNQTMDSKGFTKGLVRMRAKKQVERAEKNDWLSDVA